MKTFITTLYIISFMIFFTACGGSEAGKPTEEEVNTMEQEFNQYADKFEEILSDLYTKSALAYFDASIVSNDENWKKASDYEIQMNNLLSNVEIYNKLKSYKETKMAINVVTMRRLDILYNEVLSKQADSILLTNIVHKQTDIEKKFSSFRATVNGQEYSDNEVESILQDSKNSDELQNIWLAHKDIGPYVEKDIIELVKMRNELAKDLGFENYHTMSLTLSEQNPEEIEILFDELDRLTIGSYKIIKEEIDSALALQNEITIEELMPWHYQNRFFQEAPKIFDIDLDMYYKDKDVVKLTQDYYQGIGLNIDKVLDKSDLYEKEGKNQHAYCIDIDRNIGDIRVLCNVTNNTSWMETMLHELGHANYELYYNKYLPWSLREPAHIFTTEAVAMFFGRLSTNPAWISKMLNLSKDETKLISKTCHKQEQVRQLVFSRWAQVMYRFEKGLYANPDQDLNLLWWSLVEKYQMIKKPVGRNMPDWATKIHIATAPCYYHNYLLGEMLASQFHYRLKEILDIQNDDSLSFANSIKIGIFFKKEVFESGKLMLWNDMIKKATGSKLDPRFYAKQYVK